MRITYIIPALISLAAVPVAAVTDAQFDTIRNLGRLNGVALHCQYLSETKRMKKALVNTLPKRRELGLAFDELTNKSFIEFINEGQSCPVKADFLRQVDTAIRALQESF